MLDTVYGGDKADSDVGDLTVASFKRQEGIFRAFRSEDEFKHSKDPQESP